MAGNIRELLPVVGPNDLEIVEELLRTARLYRRVGPVRKETRLTPAYIPRGSSRTNLIRRPVEEVALDNVDEADRLATISKAVELAVGALPDLERDVIERGYLTTRKTNIEGICMDLAISESSYYRARKAALRDLALVLGVV